VTLVHRPTRLTLIIALALAGSGALGSPVTAAQVASPVELPFELPDRSESVRFDPNTVLVRFRQDVSPTARERVMVGRGLRLRAQVRRTDFFVAGTRGRAPRTVIRQLRSAPEVAEVQLNYLREVHRTPNDDLYVDFQKKYLSNARFPQAWDVTLGSTDTSVAVVDTGVDLTHPDLDGSRLKAGYDFVNDDADPGDDNGHGTFVAGAAAAITNNSEGIAGAAWKGGIIPVKVLDQDGLGTDADIAAGITWATDNGAAVMNLSFGGPAESQVLEDAVNYALSQDVVVVASAGNEGASLPSYPAAYDGVLAVSATDRSGTFAYFSNWGWWVDISAPGMFITSTYWFGGDHLYATGHGSSFAAPLVAGAALLVRYENPSWSQADVVDQLLDTAQDRGPAGGDPFFGRGWLDAYAALGGAEKDPAGVPAQDSLEPDGTVNRANNLTSSTSTPTISPEGDEDWFKTTVNDPGSITYTVTPPGPDPQGDRTREMDPVLEVYGPDYHLIGTMDQTFLGEQEVITSAVEVPGTYYLRVRNYLGSRSSGTYDVEVDTSTSFPSPEFEPYVGYDPGGEPKWTVIADVTGDGLSDLLTTTSSYADPKNKLFLYPQNTDGTLAEPTQYPTSGGGTHDMDIAAGDLDGDGLLDVGVAVAGPPDVTGGIDVFYQTMGTLSGPTFIPVSRDAQEVEIADMDGDLDNDMVVQMADGLVVLTNAGSGFTESSPMSTFNHVDIEVGDVSGDGRPDVAAICGPYSLCSYQSMEVFIQQPGGTFVGQTHTLSGDGRGVAVADVTGDDLTDVVASVGGNRPSSKLNIFAQNEAGGLDVPTNKSSYDIPTPIEALDLNGDGRLDLAVGHHAWSRVGVYLQNADGTLGSETLVTVPYGNYDPTSLSLGDLNGDSAPDIALADSGQVLVLPQAQSDQGAPLWIRNTSPPDFDEDVERSKNVTVTFQRGIDPASISSATAYVMRGDTWVKVTITLTFDQAAKKLTFDKPTNYAKNTPYVVFVDGVADVDGNVMPTYTFRFTTGTQT
jgi:type VII secretion-associated serine protease mycosin